MIYDRLTYIHICSITHVPVPVSLEITQELKMPLKTRLCLNSSYISLLQGLTSLRSSHCFKKIWEILY